MKKTSVTVSIRYPEQLLKNGWIYILIALLLAPSFVWITRDHTVWPWDQAWYGEVSVDSWFSLGSSLSQWWHTMMTGMNIKPPATVWLGQIFVPLADVFGSVETALLASVLLTQFGVLWTISKIGEGMFPGSRLIAAAGVVFAAGSQLFVGLSHQLLVEPLQALAVAWVFLIALKSAAWPKPRIAVHLAAALILGALTKATTPLLFVAPCAYTAFVFLRKPPSSSFAGEWKCVSSRVLILSSGCFGALGACWYARNLLGVWQHVRDAASGDIALQYGFHASVLGKLIVWAGLLNQSFLAPYLLWVFAAAVIMAVTLRPRPDAPRQKPSPDSRSVALLSAIQTAIVLLVFSMNDTVEARYLYGVLPCFAILFMRICAFVPSRNSLVALIVLCGLQWATVHRVALGAKSTLANQSPWLLQLAPDRSRYDELTRIVQETSAASGRYDIIAVEDPWLNANSAAFFAAKNRLRTGVRCYYTSLGYAQKDFSAALKRIDDLQTKYLIALDEPFQTTPPNFLNIVSLPVLREIKRDGRFQRVSFESTKGVVVFERTRDAAPVQPATRAAGLTVPAGPDLRTAPPAIRRATPAYRGKSSLDWVNGSAVIQDQGRRVFVVKAGAPLTCDGWAFDDAENTTPENVWLELTGVQTNQRYYLPVDRYNRQVLADAFKLPSIKMSGISCRKESVSLPPGIYAVKIYQVHERVAVVSDFSTYQASPFLRVE